MTKYNPKKKSENINIQRSFLDTKKITNTISEDIIEDSYQSVDEEIIAKEIKAAFKKNNMTESATIKNEAAEADHENKSEVYESENGQKSADKNKVNKKRKKLPIILTSIFGGLLIIIIGVIIAIHSVIGGFKSVKLDKEDLGIIETTTSTDKESKAANITNIAFFGIDTRDWLDEIGDQYRSDSIIIMSINPLNNTIKMTSILRDSKVPVEGYGEVKINSAYQKGGAALAVKTLNQNFKLDIEDYVTVDFNQLAEVIDIIGGVDIELSYNEAELVNNYAMDEMHYYDSFAYEGLNHLNGAQAVSYARIRKIDTDVYRASRQQTVLSALFAAIKDTSKSKYPTLIKQLLECVETSLTYAKIISLVSSVDVSSAELIKNTVPDVNYQANIWGGYDESIDAWVWIYDLDDAANRIHTIIYGTEGNGEGETEVETVDPNSSDITY